MESHLNRRIFHRILFNEPIHHRLCVSRTVIQSTRRPNGTIVVRPPPRRTLFGFSSKSERKTKEVDLDPGLSTMLEFNDSCKSRTRPPPASQLIKGFNQFFSAKHQSQSQILGIQAHHAAQTFRHLQETNKNEEGCGLSLSNLQIALRALERVPPEEGVTHSALARAIFAEIKSITTGSSHGVPLSLEDVSAYIAVLSATGYTLEARDLVEDFWSQDHIKIANRLWIHVIKGFGKENNEHELARTIEIMEARQVPFDCKLHQAITTHYARKDNVEVTKKWYTHPIVGGQVPTYHTNYVVLQFCIRNRELEWGSTLFRSILESSPNKSTWDIIFIWAASNGKGVDEIDRMMEVMVRRNEGSLTIRPDIATINGLVEFAISRKDPYTAERYIALGQKWRITPNARTYTLQMDYRISVGDVDGARAAYSKLQGEETTKDEDVPCVNKLIQAMCSVRHVDYDAIMGIVEDLNERKARLDPDTLSTLCALHLERDEWNDVIDLLMKHTFHYSLEQRAKVRDGFVDFCLNRVNSTARAWDAYMIFRQVFEETDIGTRTIMMREFFQRKRSDMACHVFGHMRQHIRQELRPKVETYGECFEGIAEAADLEGLEMVHNMLKLDFRIEPTTSLYNSLMLAYTACKMPDRSLEFWEDITNSREGPTYSSIQIALRACEETPFGETEARKIWHSLNNMDIELTNEVFASYVGVLAGWALFEEVKGLVQGMNQHYSLAPIPLTLGTVYNAIPGQTRKDEVEHWGRTTYPEIWTELEKLGRKPTEDGSQLFQIVRNVAA
ncbi:MAG: hypothetical protein M1835_001890 [Candelina submexicana]|nr:MAG: hypothetical protein M1835_001890 [Candelina submexicana]